MPNDHRTATVHYRKLMRVGNWNQQSSLSNAIQDALDTAVNGTPLIQDWRLRVTVAPNDPLQRRFINDSHPGGDYVFGNLCAFSTNEMQAVVSTAGTGAAVSIQDLRPPGGNDYLHGIAYWAVVGDHCYIVQHARVRTKALEEYLTWLLRDATSTVSETVTLQSTFDPTEVGADPGDVRSIEIGGLAPETVRDDPQVSVDQDLPTGRVVETRRSLAERLAPWSRARPLLEAALGTLETERIIRRVPTEAALQVKLLISYLSKRHEIDRAPLGDLGLAVRNLDDGEVRVRGKNGTITQGEARLHENVRFRRTQENSNLLDMEDVHEKLLDLHTRFLQEGRISD